MIRLLSPVLFFTVIGLVCGLTVEERLNELERIIVQQNEALVKHENLIQEQRDKLETVLSENSVLKSRIKKLENVIELLEETSVDDGETGDVTESVGDQTIVGHGILKRRDIPLRNNRNRLHSKNNPHLRRETLSENVAYYAHIQGTPCLHDHEVLIFNVEEIDVGNGYSEGDGIFTVPVSGTYVFTWTTSARSDWFDSDIVVNGDVRGSAVVDAHGDSEIVQATGLIVTNVSVGDRVFIRKAQGADCNIHDRGYLSTFAGWLLF